MEIEFNARREFLAESMQEARVEDVPEYQVKTPLQQGIQILKRHRDIMFVEDPDDKPISIIITTLAAHAYNNESYLPRCSTESCKRHATLHPEQQWGDLDT